MEIINVISFILEKTSAIKNINENRYWDMLGGGILEFY